MIRFSVFGTEIRLEFSFFMFTGLICMINGTEKIILFFIACLIHELGHLIAMGMFGAKAKGVYISGLGIKIYQDRNRLISTKKEMLILICGPLANFIIYFISFKGIFSLEFAEINIILGIFNLLPFRKLDGGSIIMHASECQNMQYNIEKLIKLFSIVVIIVSCIFLYEYRFYGFSFIAVIIYYCFTEILD